MAGGLLVSASSIGRTNVMFWASTVAGLAGMATSQYAPATASAFSVRHRDVVFGHVARAGWWNLIGFAVAGGGLWFVP